MPSDNNAMKKAIPSIARVNIDETPIGIKAYTVSGNNYFKIRDLRLALDFNVEWDSQSKTISVDTIKGYHE